MDLTDTDCHQPAAQLAAWAALGLTARFLPIVTGVADRIGLARQSNSLAGHGANLGPVKPQQVRIERHVTGRALDGLYLTIGEEERKIREDRLSAGAAIAKKALGALR